MPDDPADTAPSGSFLAFVQGHYAGAYPPEDVSFTGRPLTLRTLVDLLVGVQRERVAQGQDAADVAIWRDGRIEAVIRRGPDGVPVATLFGTDT